MYSQASHLWVTQTQTFEQCILPDVNVIGVRNVFHLYDLFNIHVKMFVDAGEQLLCKTVWSLAIPYTHAQSRTGPQIVDDGNSRQLRSFQQKLTIRFIKLLPNYLFKYIHMRDIHQVVAIITLLMSASMHAHTFFIRMIMHIHISVFLFSLKSILLIVQLNFAHIHKMFARKKRQQYFINSKWVCARYLSASQVIAGKRVGRFSFCVPLEYEVHIQYRLF